MIKVVFFDFGGVLAEEGFKNALRAIGKRQGIPDLFERADRLIYENGYVLGLCDERQFWDNLRRETGLKGTDAELRKEVLDRFTLRPSVVEQVKTLKRMGIRTAMLSDQTNWLDEIDRRNPFQLHFDRVFNSYKTHKGKRNPSVFGDVCREMGVSPEEAVLVDDNPENIRRAEESGMKGILLNDVEGFPEKLRQAIEKG